MTEQEKKAARDHAIRQMNYFRLHEDTRMYIFWRSVYRHYQDETMKAQRAAFLFHNEKKRAQCRKKAYNTRRGGIDADRRITHEKGYVANTEKWGGNRLV